MLPEILKNTVTSTYSLNEFVWAEYLQNIGEYANSIDKEFLSQICFEHFDRFNSYFPFFCVKKHTIVRIKKSSKEIYDQIRYDDNQKIDFWYFQVDDFLEKSERANYNVLRFAIENGTWSFPPVIIENTLANQIGKQNFGNPIHLIEGTHRVSFINRLYELNFIKSDTEHELLCVVER